MNDLLSINVNEHTEKKGALTYLSWAWAWAEVLKYDAGATWVAHLYGPQGSEQPCMWIGDTAMVHTSVVINGIRRDCMLPVMDNKNNAVKSPDARKVSDAIMRCMTKAIAMHGLGLYIYAGEDLPQVDQPEPGPDEFKVWWAARQPELDELMLVMLDHHNAGQDLKAVELFYRAGTLSDDMDRQNAEKLYIWNGLNKHSALRSALKANKPVAA